MQNNIINKNYVVLSDTAEYINGLPLVEDEVITNSFTSKIKYIRKPKLIDNYLALHKAHSELVVHYNNVAKVSNSATRAAVIGHTYANELFMELEAEKQASMKLAIELSALKNKKNLFTKTLDYIKGLFTKELKELPKGL